MNKSKKVFFRLVAEGTEDAYLEFCGHSIKEAVEANDGDPTEVFEGTLESIGYYEQNLRVVKCKKPEESENE